MNSKINNIITKINRFSAWVLLITISFYIITGYGMTKGIINPSWARSLHLQILPGIMMFAFLFHTLFSIRLSFMRWRIYNNFTKSILTVIFLLAIGSFTYVGYFYKTPSPKISATNNQFPSAQKIVLAEKTNPELSQFTPAKNVVPQKTTNNPTVHVFNGNELSQYNGQNGKPAYVAISGKVYDFSSVFVGGYHHGYSAGQDLTAAFANQHDPSFLNGFPVVGIYK